MPRFTDTKKLFSYLRKAEAATLKETIVTVQARLTSSRLHPVDTGRMRSSWYATEGAPSQLVPLVTEGGRQNDARQLEVRPGSVYFLVNNLPYAKPVALGINLPESWGPTPRSKKIGKGKNSRVDPNWYINFRDTTIPKIQELAAQTIKRRYDL